MPATTRSHRNNINTNELSTNKKTILRRSTRNVPRVNYAGMDMNEDDEGVVHVSKRTFEDGVVKHYWKSYPMSQVNEIEDDDYTEDKEENDN